MCHQISAALEARELIKLRVLENSGYTAREAADVIAEQTEADVSYCRLSRKLDETLTCDTADVKPIIHTQQESMEKLLFEMGKYAFCCYLYKRDILVNNHIVFDV